jgi:hypothetical protein
VEERQRGAHAVLGRDLEDLAEDLGAGDQVAVGELGALGPAGRARGVEDDRVVAGVAGLGLVDGRVVGEVGEFGVEGPERDVERGGGVLRRGADLVPAEHERDAGVLADVLELGTGGHGVGGHGDRAGGVDAVVGARELGDRRGDQQDAVAGLYAGVAQPRGDRRGVLAQTAVGPRLTSAA